MSQPGGWAKLIIGATTDTLASLGDASHASDKPGGWLTGVENTLAARNQRIGAQKQLGIENAQKQQQLNREGRSADANIARAQADTRLESPAR